MRTSRFVVAILFAFAGCTSVVVTPVADVAGAWSGVDANGRSVSLVVARDVRSLSGIAILGTDTASLSGSFDGSNVVLATDSIPLWSFESSPGGPSDVPVVVAWLPPWEFRGRIDEEGVIEGRDSNGPLALARSR